MRSRTSQGTHPAGVRSGSASCPSDGRCGRKSLSLDLEESVMRMLRNDMQSNRVWIAVLLVTSFLASPPVKARESGTSNDPTWQRASDLVKKLTLDEKLQFILSKYP